MVRDNIMSLSLKTPKEISLEIGISATKTKEMIEQVASSLAVYYK